MRSTVKLGLAAIALAGVVGVRTPALADHVTVGVAVPGIAFGYDDGYWDREHRWHDWQNRQEAARWREEHREHYYAWRHDRDRDDRLGWRDDDRWWDRH